MKHTVVVTLRAETRVEIEVESDDPRPCLLTLEERKRIESDARRYEKADWEVEDVWEKE